MTMIRLGVIYELDDDGNWIAIGRVQRKRRDRK